MEQTKGQNRKTMWNHRYSLGVPEIDKEHQRLFSIIDKIMELTENGEDNKAQYACREGVKFFKNYTLAHFAHEEEFMESINYGGFERHKKIHEDLKNHVLPTMEKELEESGYSIQSMKHFLGICTAWLSIHIKSEDQAITNKRVFSPVQMEIGSHEEIFEKCLKSVIAEMYGLEIESISNRYTGWDFGKAIFHEMAYAGGGRKLLRVIYAMEEKMVLALAAENLGVELKRMDEFVMSAVRVVLSELGNRISTRMGMEGEYKSRSGVMLNTSEIERIFNNKTILYSTLFRTPMGNFACSIYE